MNECYVNVDFWVLYVLLIIENRRGFRQVFFFVEGLSKVIMVNDCYLVLFCIICNLCFYFGI